MPGDSSPDRSAALERWVQVVIMLAIGVAAGAGSFRHVHDVAVAHGQDGWLAWADAIVLELMSVASGLELRRRKHDSTRFPAVVMAVSVVLSLSAQVVEAERSVIGWVAAAIPALGFLVMVKIALARAGAVSGNAVEPHQEEPVLLADPSKSGAVSDQQSEGREEEANADLVSPAVEVLIPAARAAAKTLHQQKRRVTRKSPG